MQCNSIKLLFKLHTHFQCQIQFYGLLYCTIGSSPHTVEKCKALQELNNYKSVGV